MEIKIDVVKKHIISLLKWCMFGILIGIVGGVIGTAFSYTLSFVTNLRLNNTWLLYLLPIGGLVTVGVYCILKLKDNRGTNEVIDAVLEKKALRPLIAPAIFICTAITQMFGGSAGREGASLQIGGSVASLIARLFRLNDDERKILIMCGMSAVFASVFGSPLTATIFVIEFLVVGTYFLSAILPCFLASITAGYIASSFGLKPETAVLGKFDFLEPLTIIKLFVLAIAISLLGIMVCHIFHGAEKMFAKLFVNKWIRIVLGSIVLIVLTLCVGNQRYNGAGMEMALHAVEGHAFWYDFLMKILFTAITLAAGFKGGEIVPAFCIGATFGCFFGGVIGMPTELTAALGLVALFCAVTNSPIASVVLSIEMFGMSNLPIFVFVCLIVFIASGKASLYSSQKRSFFIMNLIKKK